MRSVVPAAICLRVQMTWHPQSPDQHPADGLGRDGPQSGRKVVNKCSAHAGTPSRVGKAPGDDLMKLVERSVQSCYQSKIRLLWQISLILLLTT